MLLPTEQTVYIWVLNWFNYLDSKYFFWDILSPLEKQKAKKFLCSVDQDKSIIVRGLLRILVGHLMAYSPKEVNFQYGQWGNQSLCKQI